MLLKHEITWRGSDRAAKSILVALVRQNILPCCASDQHQCDLQRTKKNAEEPENEEEEEEEAAEAPSDKDLKEETVKILEDAGEDFSLKDLLAKLGERSHTPCNPHAFSCSGFLDQACIAHLQEGVAGTHYCNDQYLLS